MTTSRRSRWPHAYLGAAFVAAVLVFVAATAALADQVQNDVAVDANGDKTVTVFAGGPAATVAFHIAAQTTGGDQAGCNASDGSSALVTIVAPAAVTASPASLTFAACATPQSVGFSSATAGSYNIAVTVTDTGGGTYNVNPAKFQLVVQDPPPSDDTAPTIECDEPDGAWHADDVSLACTASDDGSGLADDDDASFSLSTDVPAGTETEDASTGSRQVCDNADNCATAGPIAGNKVDKKGPTVTCDDAPQFTKDQAEAEVSATVADGGSGPAASPVTAPADTSAVGSYSAIVTGYDDVGNETSADCEYSVIYAWAGFYRPVDNLSALNVAKAGSAIPVKFSLSGDQGLAILAAGSPTSKISTCEAAGTPDVIETTATAGQSGMSYDASLDRYTYVWKTDKGWAGTCRTLTVRLNDGTIHQALFKFTK